MQHSVDVIIMTYKPDKQIFELIDENDQNEEVQEEVEEALVTVQMLLQDLNAALILKLLNQAY